MAKQNKFTKSVMERLAETDKVGEGSGAPKIEATLTPIEPIRKKSPPKKTAPSGAAVKQPTLPNISEFIIKKDARSAKNKTFYLDTQVIDALKTVAIREKITDSKLANDILRKVLGLDK